MSLGRFDTSSRDKPMSEINMTPLVDVMLVLVAILIITAPLLASRIALDLPKAEGATQAQPQVEALRIALQADGALYLDDQPVTREALAQRLQQTAQVRPETEVQLRADASVPYGQVVQVMGLAQQAGLGRIGFVALQPKH
jgi:biopolymer transport protein TolR